MVVSRVRREGVVVVEGGCGLAVGDALVVVVVVSAWVGWSVPVCANTNLCILKCCVEEEIKIGVIECQPPVVF